MPLNAPALRGGYPGNQGYGNPTGFATAWNVSKAFMGSPYDLLTCFSDTSAWSVYGVGDSITLLNAFKGQDSHGVTQASFAPITASSLGYSNISVAIDLIVKGGNPTYATGIASPYPYDQYFTTTGQQLASLWPNAYVRLGHEFNGNGSYPWSKPSTAWTADADYLAFFRRAALALKAQAPNIKIVWNPLLHANTVDPRTVYPGDDVVDVIAIDPYDQYYGSSPSVMNARWSGNMTVGGWSVFDWLLFAHQHNKPVAAPEWGMGNGTTNSGTYKDDSLYMRNQLALWEFLTLSGALEYQTPWDYHASDMDSCWSQATLHPKSASIISAEFATRATRLIGTGKPVVVQKVVSKNGAVSLSGVTAGNVLVVGVMCDENTGLLNKNNGFSANLVGLDAGTHRWRKTHGANAVDRAVAAFHRTANSASDGVRFVPPAGWRGTVTLMEVSGFASLSIIPGTVTVTGNNTTITAKVPTLSRGLAMVQIGGSPTPIILSQSRTTATDISLSTSDGGSNYYGSAILELDGSPNTLSLTTSQALAPLCSVLLLNGRASVPSGSVSVPVQSNSAAGRSAALTAAPTLGNTLLGIWCGDNNGSAGGTLPPSGWTEVMDAVPWLVSDNIAVAYLPVTDVTQTTAAFQAATTGGYTTIIELPGNVSITGVSGRPYADTGSDLNNPTQISYPVNLDATALNLCVLEANSTQRLVTTGMTGITSITSRFSSSANARAALVFSMPSSLQNIVIGAQYGLYGGHIAVLTIKPN